MSGATSCPGGKARSDRLGADPVRAVQNVLMNGGEMGALMRAHDWKATPIGSPDMWPQALRTTVRLLLTTRHPMFIWWGPELIQFYNDAYGKTLGPERHPSALGQCGRECWAEIWPIIGPQIDQVMTGGDATWHEDHLVPITRHGQRENVWWTYGYSPIDEPSAPSGVGGVMVICNDVTHEHLARTALREAEERTRLALAAADSVGTWDWEVAADRVHADAGFARLYGVDPIRAEAGVPVAEFTRTIHPDDLAEVKEAITAVARTGGDFSGEYRLLQADGSVRWVAALGRCLLDSDGLPSRFPGVTIDITERKQAEATLRESQDRLSAALTIAELGTFDWNVQAGDVTLDDRSRAIFGFAPGEGTRAKEVFDRIEPADFDRVFAEAQASLKALSRLETEYQIIRPAGAVRTVVSISDVMQDADGQPERLFKVFSDITERKRTEADLRRLNETLEQKVQARTRDLVASEARLRAYFSASPEYLLLMRMSPDGGVIFDDLNAAAEGLCGRSRADVVGHLAADLLDPATATDLERRAQECLQTGGPVCYETKLQFQVGNPLVLNVVLAPLPAPDGGKPMMLFCGRDFTEQRLMEEALRQSQKMEAVGQLTGGLAHDFNNLLTGITGSLELLQTRVTQGRLKELDRYVNAAQGAARRAAALTHRLLAFSRRQTLEPKPTDVNRLVAGMEELIRRTMRPEISIESVAGGGLWTTLVDRSQLENALLNLCINARDAMPGGGKLTIETGNRWLDDRGAKERDIPPGQYVSLCVSDSGTGMTPELIARAFDPFFTTKPIGQGTGLGLSMIYGFVRQSGGQVRIYSEVGQGTMVCLYLPRHLGKAEAADLPVELSDAPRAEPGETVLVVDDEPTVRMLVTEVLGDLGYTAIEAADGPAGLRILQSDVRIDLLVTDVGLPGGMNGRQLADAARVPRPNLKVLFITGYAENAVLSHGHLDPGMQVMTKPFAMEALATRLKDLIDGR